MDREVMKSLVFVYFLDTGNIQSMWNCYHSANVFWFREIWCCKAFLIYISTFIKPTPT